jgi:HD-like signal output (HDOD) protein
VTTDRLAIADLTWNDGAHATVSAPPTGWVRRVTAALGRLVGRGGRRGRQPGLAVLDPGTDTEDRPRPRGKRGSARGEVVDRTRPIDTQDLEEAPLPARAHTAVPHPPPPPLPARASHRMAAVAALGDAYDPLDALITMLLCADEPDLPPPPTDEELAWVELLAPLVEYELMARGGAALSFQSTATQLAELVALADTDFNGAVRLVSRDPAVAAAILSAANSASSRRGGTIGDIRTAIARVGLAETRRIGIAAATRALHDPDATGVAAHHRARSHRDLHRSMTCALASASLAARTMSVGGEDAFVAGMFFDLGRPLVHRAVQALERRQRVQPVPAAALDVVIERTHAEVGAEALAAWGLPRRFSDLARHHLSPAPPPPAVAGLDLDRLALVSSFVFLRVGAVIPMGAARRATAALGLERAELRRLALDVSELAERVTDLFRVRDGATTWGAPQLRP